MYRICYRSPVPWKTHRVGESRGRTWDREHHRMQRCIGSATGRRYLGENQPGWRRSEHLESEASSGQPHWDEPEQASKRQLRGRAAQVLEHS